MRLGQKSLEAWRHRRETETKAAYLAKLREKYGVVVDDGIGPLLVPPRAEAKRQ